MIPPQAEYYKLACAVCKTVKWFSNDREWVSWATASGWGIGEYVWDGETEILHFCETCSFGAHEKRRNCKSFGIIRDLMKNFQAIG